MTKRMGNEPWKEDGSNGKTLRLFLPKQRSLSFQQYHQRGRNRAVTCFIWLVRFVLSPPWLVWLRVGVWVGELALFDFHFYCLTKYCCADTSRQTEKGQLSPWDHCNYSSSKNKDKQYSHHKEHEFGSIFFWNVVHIMFQLGPPRFFKNARTHFYPPLPDWECKPQLEPRPFALFWRHGHRRRSICKFVGLRAPPG